MPELVTTPHHSGVVVEPRTRTVSIRLPYDLYCQIAGLAQGDNVSLNLKIRQLCALGLNKHISTTDAIKKLIVSTAMENS